MCEFLASIFRRVTRLGKISEENLEGNNSKGNTIDKHPNLEASYSTQPDREVMEEKSIEEIRDQQQQNESLAIVTTICENGTEGSPAAVSRKSEASSLGSSAAEGVNNESSNNDNSDNPPENNEVIESHLHRSPGLANFAEVH